MKMGMNLLSVVCRPQVHKIFYRERASQLARKSAKEKLEERVEEEVKAEGERQVDLFPRD
jgi:hypothetical protein